MANDKCSNLKTLDPVQGLVDYVNDVKPYHTKIIEVSVEYQYDEAADTTMLETLQISTCGAELCGSSAARWYLINNSSVEDNYFLITGDVSADFVTGLQFLVVESDEMIGSFDIGQLYELTQDSVYDSSTKTTFVYVDTIIQSVAGGWAQLAIDTDMNCENETIVLVPPANSCNDYGTLGATSETVDYGFVADPVADDDDFGTVP